MKKFLVFLVLYISCQNTPSPNQDVPQFILYKSYPVDAPEAVQPSGLTIWQQQLFTVSDKNDSTIFRIELKNHSAELHPYRVFTTEPASEDHLDFEGITCDSAGNFYLVSETQFKILKVAADGSPATWITPDLKSYGQKVGLFQVKNAYFEGITPTAPNRFILCPERQPRGIMKVDIGTQPIQVKAFNCDQTRYHFANGRSHDFAGLFFFQNELYVLERNAFVVSKLLETENGFEEGAGWSYEHIETSDILRYDDMRYGKAEGLAMDEAFIYLILDNNNDARITNSDDKRPLLFQLKRPAGK